VEREGISTVSDLRAIVLASHAVTCVYYGLYKAPRVTREILSDSGSKILMCMRHARGNVSPGFASTTCHAMCFHLTVCFFNQHFVYHVGSIMGSAL